MQSAKRKPEMRYRSARWHTKERDDVIIQRWAEACSEKYNDCLGCPYTKECQDLMDRLISCMDVPKAGHRVRMRSDLDWPATDTAGWKQTRESAKDNKE